MFCFRFPSHACICQCRSNEIHFLWIHILLAVSVIAPNAIRHSRLPAGNALWFCQNFFFFFFRRQGFRMITFDRQVGPLQNFNRSHIMVIGRSVLFSDPARPPGGAWGAPNTPKSPPPEFYFYFFPPPPPPPTCTPPPSPQNTHPNPLAIINNPNNCSMTYRL